MDEPTLESIDDYDTLKGEKKRIVWMVIIGGLVVGLIFALLRDDGGAGGESVVIHPVTPPMGKAQ